MAVFEMKNEVTLLLCGDVMTGRGVDQILPHPSNPMLYESYVKDARHYVELAQKTNGAVEYPVDYAYIWGHILTLIKEADVRIINLETSITTSEHYADKGINYRMHPKNAPCLTAGGIDCCALANNHIMDWGKEGLLETLETLGAHGIVHSGAGQNSRAAKEPGVINLERKGRILVFSFGFSTSGIPGSWKAKENSPGVNLLEDFSLDTVKRISQEVSRYKKHYDVVVASIHWGGNWGYEIPGVHQKFARNLVDLAKVDVVHGHSSHHFLGIEHYHGKPIIYGCGDLLNDYEGIWGHESYRAHLGLLYFVSVDVASGHTVSLKIVPTEVKRLQITWPNRKNRRWVQKVFNRESRPFGTTAVWNDDHGLSLVWNPMVDH